MRNSGPSGGGGLRAEDVISKLKDDGDFDRLRVKIIRKLKENTSENFTIHNICFFHQFFLNLTLHSDHSNFLQEELRSNIISLVKQSTALNCPGAEKMKPRQLSDAIHQEIGDKIMSQVSDGVWNIIRSPDGMKPEITETVQSVYDKLANPRGKNNCQSSSRMKPENNISADGACENKDRMSDGEPNEPPGFGLTNRPYNIDMPPHKGQMMKENKGKNLHLDKPDIMDSDAPPGFSCVFEHKKSGESPDEDPEVPPGFG
ncbi:hypothetical protein ACJIZ3_004045 [Penstemon smallii]|uniref:Uncharacterized protein n=1 Tax=Penstemon smallii TaxID=265156 RepID=A0ABD3S123_9LAMI